MPKKVSNTSKNCNFLKTKLFSAHTGDFQFKSVNANELWLTLYLLYWNLFWFYVIVNNKFDGVRKYMLFSFFRHVYFEMTFQLPYHKSILKACRSIWFSILIQTYRQNNCFQILCELEYSYKGSEYFYDRANEKSSWNTYA